jgi:hypothetical protein
MCDRLYTVRNHNMHESCRGPHAARAQLHRAAAPRQPSAAVARRRRQAPFSAACTAADALLLPPRPSPAVALRRRRAPFSAACSAAGADTDPRAYGEGEYLATRQSKQRAEWAAAVRGAGAQGRRRSGGGAPAAAPPPALDPPPRLSRVSVVLVAPLRPRTVGTVARLCACFEALDLRLVTPRCDHLGRRAPPPAAGRLPSWGRRGSAGRAWSGAGAATGRPGGAARRVLRLAAV